ncbi:beta-lactamase family protein [Gammaproteobacteria bacterium]|nr:beta-lactamase family protein [Gammaproteobacteria bacterium]MDA9038892.1 beta-lactamase family protein [Gammaproteobacteria bacterium]
MTIKKPFCLFVFLIVSCGGGGNSQQSAVSLPSPPVTPSHPIVWDIATPESVGMNKSVLDEAFRYAMEDGSYTQAAVVIKDGKLVYERYRGITRSEASVINESISIDFVTLSNLYDERDVRSYVSSWSTAKSFTSILIALAVEEGFINSINDLASSYITEWSTDERSVISIKNLLDMRSGLVPMCFIVSINDIGECQTASGASSGGNIVYSNDQMTKCISRDLANEGETQPWYANGSVPFTRGSFLYSNCDTMVLGEIIFRATGQDLQTFAEYNLFSKIGIEASWWRDFSSDGQSNGNYLAYCCLDMTARDFAKFGHMLLQGGVWENGSLKLASYVDAIKNLQSYGLQFWTLCSNPASSPCDEYIISTIGFDGQYIMIDFDRNLVVVRASLYEPVQNISSDRKMKLFPDDLSSSNWVATVPSGLGAAPNSTFSASEFVKKVIDSVN